MPSSKTSRSERREKVERLRRQEAARGRRRQIVIIGVVVGVLVIAAIAGIAIQSSRNTSPAGSARPAGVTAAGAIPVGPAGAPVTVDVYEDFQCPYCELFESKSGPALAELVSAGTAQANYHVLSFIGPDSVRAANAAGCAADQGKFPAYHQVLFANQPPENTGGYKNADLIRFGQQVGLTDDAFSKCVQSGRYNGWVADVQETASKANITQTPTVKINGRQVDAPVLEDPAQFRAAVEAARKG